MPGPKTHSTLSYRFYKLWLRRYSVPLQWTADPSEAAYIDRNNLCPAVSHMPVTNDLQALYTVYGLSALVLHQSDHKALGNYRYPQYLPPRGDVASYAVLSEASLYKQLLLMAPTLRQIRYHVAYFGPRTCFLTALQGLSQSRCAHIVCLPLLLASIR